MSVQVRPALSLKKMGRVFHIRRGRVCSSASMPEISRIAAVRSAILRWFSRNCRDLPWRRTRDAWRVLVSELMLQQTQVDRVIPKYDAFIARWPTPAALATSPLGEVLRSWSGLGYNRRAKHLHAAAKAVVARFGGRVPRTVKELESLPGVGRYTARAVASFAYGDDVALWDTNVRRIFLRVFTGGEFSRRATADTALEAMLDAALPRGRSRDWYGALMDFGSAVCLGRKPRCEVCPLARSCVAAASFRAGRTPRTALVKRQAGFEGSWRQGRGAVVRLLADTNGGLALAELVRRTGRADAPAIVEDLAREGLVVSRSGKVRLA